MSKKDRERKSNTQQRHQRWVDGYVRLFNQGLRNEHILEELRKKYGVATSTLWRVILNRLKKTPNRGTS